MEYWRRITPFPTERNYKRCDHCERFTDWVYPAYLRGDRTPIEEGGRRLYRLCGNCAFTKVEYYNPMREPEYKYE